MSRMWHRERERPLVALVSPLPVVAAAIEDAIDFADFVTFGPDGGDVGEMLRWLDPDAVVVDNGAGTEAATSYAVEGELPVLHLSLHAQVLRVLGETGWEDASDDDPDPAAVRDALAGALFGTEGTPA